MTRSWPRSQSCRFGDGLQFSNDLDLLREEIAREFPTEVDAFQRLVGAIIDYDDLDGERAQLSARDVIGSLITDPTLIEMLLCPLMYYGSAREDDVEFGQFSIMFRAIYMEGLGRPHAGVRVILRNLVRRFRSLGGELRLRAGVQRMVVEDEHVTGLVLDNGEEVCARRVLSSAGWTETMKLCDDGIPVSTSSTGRLSFCETI